VVDDDGLAALDERAARVALERLAQPRRQRREAGGLLDTPPGERLPDLPVALALAFKFAPALLKKIREQENVEMVHGSFLLTRPSNDLEATAIGYAGHR
jgi:hypothetical protein